MNSKPEREISKNVLEFDVNTEYKTDLITGMNFNKSGVQIRFRALFGQEVKVGIRFPKIDS